MKSLRHTLICFLSFLLLMHNFACAESIVIPPESLSQEGAGASCALCVPGREQELYSSNLFPAQPITITEIRYRPDTTLGDAGPFSTNLSEIELRLSTSTKSAVSPNLIFADNIGQDEVLVYKGPWLFKTENVGPRTGPKEFDIQLQLQVPFHYDPKRGNLLVDVRNFGLASRSYNVDSATMPGSVWRILIEDPLAVQASGSDISAPVMQIFTDPRLDEPVRASGVAQVVNGFVVGVTLTNQGAGYTNAPIVRFVGGGGTGAAGTAVVSDGRVVSITIDNAGKGYTNAPIVKISSPHVAPGLGVRTKKIEVELSLVLGHRYRLDYSQDLNQWTTLETFEAEDENVTREFDVDETGKYFRLIEVQ